MESLQDLLLNADKIPIIIEKEFTVECCVWGHQSYQTEWDGNIRSELKASHETRPGALLSKIL